MKIEKELYKREGRVNKLLISLKNKNLIYFFKGVLWTIIISIIYFIGMLLLVPFFGFYVFLLLWFPFLILSYILPFLGIYLFPVSIFLVLILGGFFNVFLQKRKEKKRKKNKLNLI